MGKRLASVALDHPLAYVKYHRGLQALRAVVVSTTAKDRDCALYRTVYIYGDPGCGKTTAVRKVWPEAYWLTESREGWLGTYDGQGTLHPPMSSCFCEVQTAHTCPRCYRRGRLSWHFPPCLYATAVSGTSIRSSDEGWSCFCGCYDGSACEQPASSSPVPERTSGTEGCLLFETGDGEKRSRSEFRDARQALNGRPTPIYYACIPESTGDDTSALCPTQGGSSGPGGYCPYPGDIRGDCWICWAQLTANALKLEEESYITL